MSASSTAVIAAVAAQRKKLIGYFVAVGALSPEKAIPPESLPRVGFHMLERLKADRVLCATPQGTLYLDQARASELQARRQRIAIRIVMGILLVTGLAAAVAVFALRAAT